MEPMLTKSDAKSIVPRTDLKPLLDEVTKLAGLEGRETTGKGESTEAPAPEMPAEEPKAETETPGAPPMTDVGPIADALAVPTAKAEAIYAAAQQMPKLAGKTPDEVAKMLSTDMELRMRVEKIAASTEDMAARDAMDAEGMAPPAPMQQ
jgi:hypothetical protein